LFGVSRGRRRPVLWNDGLEGQVEVPRADQGGWRDAGVADPVRGEGSLVGSRSRGVLHDAPLRWLSGGPGAPSEGSISGSRRHSGAGVARSGAQASHRRVRFEALGPIAQRRAAAWPSQQSPSYSTPRNAFPVPHYSLLVTHSNSASPERVLHPERLVD